MSGVVAASVVMLCMTAIPDARRRVMWPGRMAFQETFDQPSITRGRGGDLNPAIWSTARLVPDGIAGDNDNHIRRATIPVCRASFAGGTSVYPPDDSLICDGTSTNPGTLMTGVVIQNYGNHSNMIRQPFDFTGRQGVIQFDVDAVCEGALGTYIEVDLTEDPVPAPTFHIVQNDETGPLAKNALLISFFGSVGGGARVGVGAVHVYTDFAKTLLSPSFELTGSNLPTTLQNKLNRCEIRLSASNLQVWLSDYSSDGTTFPNFLRIYEASLTMPFTRGYVHLGARNHATVKYGFAAEHVYHWDNIAFDGPVLAAPRAYEIPDNTTTGTSTDVTELDYPYEYMHLGYEVSDGSGRAEGIWNPTSNISPFVISGVDMNGMSVARLSLNLFVQSVTHTPDTTWGLKTKFNGGSWRTRTLTSAEATALIANPGTNGVLCLLIDLTFADLQSGTNTLDFSTVNIPMDYAPTIQNIDLLLSVA